MCFMASWKTNENELILWRSVLCTRIDLSCPVVLTSRMLQTPAICAINHTQQPLEFNAVEFSEVMETSGLNKRQFRFLDHISDYVTVFLFKLD